MRLTILVSIPWNPVWWFWLMYGDDEDGHDFGSFNPVKSGLMILTHHTRNERPRRSDVSIPWNPVWWFWLPKHSNSSSGWAISFNPVKSGLMILTLVLKQRWEDYSQFQSREIRSDDSDWLKNSIKEGTALSFNPVKSGLMILTLWKSTNMTYIQHRFQSREIRSDDSDGDTSNALSFGGWSFNPVKSGLMILTFGFCCTSNWCIWNKFQSREIRSDDSDTISRVGSGRIISLFQSREIRSDDSDLKRYLHNRKRGFEFQSREIRSDDSDIIRLKFFRSVLSVSIPWNPVWWFWRFCIKTCYIWLQ